MAHDSHTWKQGSPPPKIRAHSLTKHRIVAEYVKRYIETLTRDPRTDRLQLTLVDGFAGGNVYTDDATGDRRPGSPSILLRAVKEAELLVRRSRRKEFCVDDRYFFIERDKEAFSCLGNTLRDDGYGDFLGSTIRLFNGSFVDFVDPIIEFVRARGRAGRVLFVLDQCGYMGVPFTEINRILASLPNAEVILTFATDFLIDFLGNSPLGESASRQLGIPIPSTISDTEKSNADWRRIIQYGLHQSIYEQSGCRFYTPFFVRSKDSHRDLWLIHMSGHCRARDVMVGLHWELNNSFAHYGGPGINMLGYDPNEDKTSSAQIWLPGFYFDETARVMTYHALYDQIPKLLHDNYPGISFDGLFSIISNGTPSTSQILKRVIRDLGAEGLLSIKDRSGLTQRRAGVQKGDDVVIADKQRRLFVWNPPHE